MSGPVTAADLIGDVDSPEPRPTVLEVNESRATQVGHLAVLSRTALDARGSVV